ncbi:Glycosyl transferase family 2 [Algoriphagus ornithinivorans]|uniref:Glycosyl transferase family 2 n=1 Tax=Algoriphagus ornithinivorans TaxID=226506 RepID=A0A1I5HHV0_9BACT|nr:glycosyltransferase family 2 protein [Algoriphagus ornithinivorans]SFO47807.1 Glycosyl transferase family 2 [Algoriphagus ornithinivorans]
MNPLVSIIIPVYNKAAFVTETLDSALRQNYTNIELILVNDGSTDGSKVILEAYQSKFPDKIILIDQPNGGVSKATNIGVQASKGEYIQFLDADDILSKDKIFRQIKLLENQDFKVMASCAWVNFKEVITEFSSLPYNVFQSFDSGLDLQLSFWNNQEMMAISSYLTHRKLIEKAGPWDDSLTINQDGEFFMRVLLQASKVLFEPNELVYYRQPGISHVSQQKSEKAFTSLLDSYQAYEWNVLAIEDSFRVRKALKKVYQKFIYDVFPKYPHLIEKAESLMDNLGLKEPTYIGGPKFQQLSKLIGFKNALRLKRILNS